MTSTLFTAIISAMTMLAAPQAAGDDPGTSRGHRGKGARMCNELQCSDEQRTQIKSIRAEHRRDVADERARAKELRAALQAERGSPRPDTERIQGLRAELSALKTEMKKAKHQMRSEVGAVLTPEQREQLAAMKAKRKANKKARRNGKRGKKGAKAHGKRGPKGAKTQGKRDRRDEARAKRGGFEVHARGQRRGQKDYTKADRRERQGKARKGNKGKAFAKRGRNGSRGSFSG